jgi:spermidine synthase
MPRRPPVIRREPAVAIPVEVVSKDSAAGSATVFPWLLLLLAGSGCAALIYEIVWFQLLQLVIGSSAVSLGLLLAAYMGGLCLGSMLLPRIIPAWRGALWTPLRIYAALELGIAALGIIALFGVPLVGRAYLAGATNGLLGLILRGVIAAVCLLPPTILMGASLPAISRWAERTQKGVSRLGLLYSANVAGAVLGCLLAGFYLLRVHDMAVATYAAAAINTVVAGLALALAGFARQRNPEGREERTTENRVARAPGALLVYLAIAFSGLAALGAEVVWTRLLSLLLGATVYTFSLILAVFLVGLWAGSGAGSFLARRIERPGLALAVCQILAALSIAWTAFHLANVLPYWPVDPWLSTNPWFTFDLDVTRCFRAIFPATLLWGASFPLALAAAAAEGEDPARLAGEVYAANTAGSIVGALIFSLALIPAIGTAGSERLLIWMAAAGAGMALAASAVRQVSRPVGGVGQASWPVGAYRLRRPIAGAALAGVALTAWGMAATVSPVPWQMIAYGRRVAPILRGLNVVTDVQPTPLFVGEGVSSSVVISQRGDQRFFYVSGKSEASSAPLDMRLQRMMGHIPALFHPRPRSVLVVGFGAGVTAGSFVPYPEVESIEICELERMIPPASDEYFAQQNYHVLGDRRVRVVYDDARHFIFTASQKFDVITTDPIHPWVKGTSTLYSKEYYELVKRHLNTGGVVAQWLPIYDSDEETVKTELATFFDVFPSATVWSNYTDGDGYDLVLIGREDGAAIDVDALQRRLDQSAYKGVAASLADAGFGSAVDLLKTYAGRASDLAPLVANVPINEDLNLRLQYLAGMGLNSVASPQIYRDILAYRQFPEGLFTGTGEPMDALRAVLGRRHRTF